MEVRAFRSIEVCGKKLEKNRENFTKITRVIRQFEKIFFDLELKCNKWLQFVSEIFNSKVSLGDFRVKFGY